MLPTTYQPRDIIHLTATHAGDTGDPEAGTVQLTTTTDDSEGWPENSGATHDSQRRSGSEPGQEVDFKKIPVDEALSILKVYAPLRSCTLVLLRHAGSHIGYCRQAQAHTSMAAVTHLENF